jgi:hypothetical protein
MVISSRKVNADLLVIRYLIFNLVNKIKWWTYFSTTNLLFKISSRIDVFKTTYRFLRWGRVKYCWFRLQNQGSRQARTKAERFCLIRKIYDRQQNSKYAPDIIQDEYMNKTTSKGNKEYSSSMSIVNRSSLMVQSVDHKGRPNVGRDTRWNCN